MSARREITKKEAGAYAAASKKATGEILNRLVAEVGWSRANARRQLGRAFKRPVWLRVPGIVLRTVVGQLGYELLLVSTRMEPKALVRSGFSFDESTPEALAQWVRRIS